MKGGDAQTIGAGSGPGSSGCGAPIGTTGGTGSATPAGAGGGGGGGACGFILIYASSYTQAQSAGTNPANMQMAF